MIMIPLLSKRRMYDRGRSSSFGRTMILFLTTMLIKNVNSYAHLLRRTFENLPPLWFDYHPFSPQKQQLPTISSPPRELPIVNPGPVGCPQTSHTFDQDLVVFSMLADDAMNNNASRGIKHNDHNNLEEDHFSHEDPNQNAILEFHIQSSAVTFDEYSFFSNDSENCQCSNNIFWPPCSCTDEK